MPIEGSCDKRRKDYICAGVHTAGGLETVLVNADIQHSVLPRAGRLTETALHLRASYLLSFSVIDKHQELILSLQRISEMRSCFKAVTLSEIP